MLRAATSNKLGGPVACGLPAPTTSAAPPRSSFSRLRAAHACVRAPACAPRARLPRTPRGPAGHIMALKRLAARTIAGCTALVALQAAALKATYKTPLDACGPHHGVASAPSGAGAAAPARENMGIGSFASRGARALSSLRGRAPCADQPLPREGPLRVLVLGDSLVSGVGSSVAGPPALPRGFAEALARKLRTQVTWQAYGRTGADVDEMRAALLPRLRDDTAPQPPTVLLLLCGLNDAKRATGSSSEFRAKLRALLHDIRALTGPQTLLVLPGLPLRLTDRFPAPLHWLVCALLERYDAQKRALAADAGADAPRHVLFVEAPLLRADGAAPRLLAHDGVHPNDEGYERWAQHIADAVAARLLHHTAATA